MKVPIGLLRQYVTQTLIADFGPTMGPEVADYLIWAELSGISTQGLVKMTGPNAIQNLQVEGEPAVDYQTSNAARYNARNSPAPYASCVLARSAMELASTGGGVGISGYHNAHSSGGALAYYTEKVAIEGYVAVMMARSPACVAAFGGMDPIFGTDPFAYSVPTDSDPITFDSATSAITMLGVVLAERRGEQLPVGVAIDDQGLTTRSASAAISGALLPYGGHKSSGVALLVEVLAGGLVGASMGPGPGEWGALLLVIDPATLGDPQRFRSSVGKLADQIRSSRSKSGEPSPRLPGDRARESRKACERSGMVDIADDLLTEIGFQV